jgi:ubiquinone/menaquinone biosynthesis C-methylase UbiE
MVSGQRRKVDTVQIDNVRFTSFELSGWQCAAEPYDESWGNLTRQTAAPILAALDLQPGDVLLDVATGPGYVAGLAASRGAKAVGVDFSPAMVAKAQTAFPQATFREGDAQDLPFTMQPLTSHA